LAGRVARVNTYIVRTDLPRPFRTSYGEERFTEHVWVEVVSDEGVTGWGEASLLPFFTGETAATVKEVIDSRLGPAIVGLESTCLGKAHSIMDAVLPHNTSAKAALDMALLDLAGKSLGVPAHDLLGGGFRDRVDMAEAIGHGEPEAMAEEAAHLVSRGFRTIKVKIGQGISRDVQAVGAIRQRVGPHVKIRVDANQRYRPKEAIRVIRELHQFDLEYVEQPVPAWDLEGLRDVRRSVDVPLMADESLYTLRDAVFLARERLVDYFGIKFIKTSGVWPAPHIAQVAHSADNRLRGHQSVGPGDSRARGLHLVAALPNATVAQELKGARWEEFDLAFPAPAEEASLPVPRAPGLGLRPRVIPGR